MGSVWWTLAVFGSVGTGTQRADSDVDLLLNCDPLPVGRTRRIAEIGKLEAQLEPTLASLKEIGITRTLSAIIKTPPKSREADFSTWIL